MPLYWAEYLADTTHLTTFQHGMYLLLIGAYWRRGGPIPSDPDFLVNVARTSKDKLARYGKPVLAMFTCENGLLHHKRIDNELLRSSTRLAAAVANGRAGGLAKSKLSTSTSTSTKEEVRSKSAAHAAIFDSNFNRFWEVFPRKDGSKTAAQTAFLACGLDLEIIIDGAKAYAVSDEAQRDEGKFSVGALRWLQEKRWLGHPKLPSPQEMAENLDRADRLLRRGKYAEKYGST